MSFFKGPILCFYRNLPIVKILEKSLSNKIAMDFHVVTVLGLGSLLR